MESCLPCSAKVILDSDGVQAAANGLAGEMGAVCEAALKLLEDGRVKYSEIRPLMDYLCDELRPQILAATEKAHSMLLAVVEAHLPAKGGGG